jgi:hypothetical protein
MDVLNSVFAALVDWLAHGFSSFNGWEILAYTLDHDAHHDRSR